jgi:hypothetical protein
MGQGDDVEGHTPHRNPESAGVPKGRTRSKRAMQVVETRLERDSELPYGDILIRPASTS